MLIRLIHDPYQLFDGRATRVCTVTQLPTLFQTIDNLLAAGGSEAVEAAVYVVDGALWNHFASYNQLAGVSVEEYLPRLLISKKFSSHPPEWVTDDLIVRAGLLCSGFGELIGGRWDETVAECLLPGGRSAETLGEWMRLACEASRLDDAGLPEEVRQVVWDQFATRLQGILPQYELETLNELWLGWETPKRFFEAALLAPARKPFQTTDTESSFYGHQDPPSSVRLAVLPLVFPLPRELHRDVSRQFAGALRRARIERRNVTKTVLSLNAAWDGVVDELRLWLNACPNALSTEAADHLESLPGSDAQMDALISRFRPPVRPAEWSSLEGVVGSGNSCVLFPYIPATSPVAERMIADGSVWLKSGLVLS